MRPQRGPKPGPRRTPFERERDLEIESRMYLQGANQYTIADAIGVSQRQISADLRKMRKRWQDSALSNIDAKFAEELARIDRMETEAWTQWERSKLDRTAETKTAESMTDETKPGKRSAVKASTRTEGRLGDPRYLWTVQWCVERRCKLLGLDAPEKRELTGKGGGPITYAEWFEWASKQKKGSGNGGTLAHAGNVGIGTAQSGNPG